jgi:NAD dependent epimerase/dehydratase family
VFNIRRDRFAREPPRSPPVEYLGDAPKDKTGSDASMKVLVTGSAGHLGEALARTFKNSKHEVVGLDIIDSAFSTHVSSIADRSCARRCLSGVQTVFQAATSGKPHVATHSRQDFVDTNITGTLNPLEEAVAAGAESFVFTSTTSVFGDALVPPVGTPAAWVTEEVAPVPKEHLWRDQGGSGGSLPVVPSEPKAFRLLSLLPSWPRRLAY